MNALNLLDPVSLQPLTSDTPHSLTDGSRRYPVVQSIPYLRTGREELVASVLRWLDAGDERRALIRLLQDQDDWAPGPPPACEALAALLAQPASLREAMRALNFGPVADYFAYRWSDPTFLSGLALLRAHLAAAAAVLEVSCGIGHYLREFELRGIQAAGGDVVFAKLWLARRYLCPATPLICFDAGSPFPFPDQSFRCVFCHDAFYFLPNKPYVAAEMKRIAGEGGAVLVGHAHNSAAPNLSAGEPLNQEQYAALFPGSVVYDDAELTRSWIENRRPQPGASVQAAALDFATNPPLHELPFNFPVRTEELVLNPLLPPGQCAPRWPSERYEQEYGALSGYLSLQEPPLRATPDLVRRRVFLSLPERW